MKIVARILLFLFLFSSLLAQTKMSPTGIVLVKHYEGLRLTSYQDVAAIWTIGWGHTGKDVRPGMRITEQQASVLMNMDLKRFEVYVVSSSSRSLKWHEFDALTSLSYNAGFRIKDAFQMAINTGNTKTVVYHIMQFNHAKVKGCSIVLSGLTSRRKVEAYLYENGKLVFK